MTPHTIKSFALGALAALAVAAAWYTLSAHAPFANLSTSPENSAANIFQVASSTGDPYLTVSADGRVGIDTAIPQTELDIRGMARVYTSTLTPCTKEIEGAIAYDPLLKRFLGCNSVEWRRIDN